MSFQIGKAPFFAYNFDGIRYDCGTKLGFTQANTSYAINDPTIGSEYKNWLNSLLKAEIWIKIKSPKVFLENMILEA